MNEAILHQRCFILYKAFVTHQNWSLFSIGDFYETDLISDESATSYLLEASVYLTKWS